MRTLFHATDRLYRTTEKSFLVVECRRCRLIRLYPKPTPTELATYYPSNYWHSDKGGRITAASGTVQQRFPRLNARKSDRLEFRYKI